MRYISFGSCLSYNVSSSYRLMFGAEQKNVIYHNRSDFFLRHHVEGKALPEREKLLNFINDKMVKSEELDLNPIQILNNQLPDSIGGHRMLTEAPRLDETLSKKDFDVVFIDNFMDVAAKNCIPFEDDFRFFARSGDFLDISSVKFEDFISPSDSARNFGRIIDFFLDANPHAKIVFLQFPYNTYESDSSRVSRSLQFLEKFSHRRVINIEPVFVRSAFRTDVSSHFKYEYYAAIAGMIHCELRGGITKKV